jgi:hypothetical protein
MNISTHGRTTSLIIATALFSYLGLCSTLPPASAQDYERTDAVAAPHFATTGSLAAARGFHTATLLPSGKVLVAAGQDQNFGVLASAELFDPATGTWSPTGSLATARFVHTATLLPSGKVLVAGGGGNGIVSSAELYDPSTGTWSSTGSLTGARARQTATLLPSGKVLVAGGTSGSTYLASAELYDPSTGTWTPTGSMSVPRWNFSATLLPSGNVLAVGGYNGSGAIATTEIYDPVTGTWSAAGPLAIVRYLPTVTTLPSGKVLVAGGFDGLNRAMATTEIYDPATGAWTPTGSLVQARGQHSTTLLPSGKVLVAGGGGDNGSLVGTGEIYDPATGSWSAAASLAETRYTHTATLLPSGDVLFAGGFGNNVFRTSCELYEAQNGSWSATASLANTREYPTATLLPSGKVLVAGGIDGGGSYLASAELYDPATGTWTPTGSLTTVRLRHTATLLQSGKVLIVSGTSAEIYDPASGVWSLTGTPGIAHAWSTATLLPNGKVLVAGGYDLTTGNPIAKAEVYDPVSGAWTPTASLAIARFYHTATRLLSGKVLVTGGGDISGQRLAVSELYDPATGTWSATGSLGGGRVYHTATLLPSGKVLAVGGNFQSPSAELYDPATGTWSATGSLNEWRQEHMAALLPSGKVLIAGGASQTVYSSAEIYNSATGTWSTTGSLADARYKGSATLLPSGEVLFAGGGQGGVVRLDSAELFDEGLGYSAARRPQISSVSSSVLCGETFTVYGTGFTGDSEASGGNGSSPTNYPIVQVRHVETGRVRFLRPNASWTDTEFDSEALTEFPVGPSLLTVFVNGIPSTSELIVDTTAPSISCPADIVVTTTSSAGAFITYLTPSASDNCGISIFGSCMPASGSTFPVGTTTVTCTATDAAGNVSAPCSFQVTVTQWGIFQFSEQVYYTTEGAGSTTITVSRTGSIGTPASVRYSTANNTASAGSDYTSRSGTLNFAPGQTSATFTVPIGNDTAVDGAETFFVRLSSPSAGTTLGRNDTTVVGILENDSAGTFDFAQSSYTVDEGGSVTVRVFRSVTYNKLYNVPASVSWTLAANTATVGNDMTGATSGTIAFGPSESSKTFTISALDDGALEGTESLRLTLGAATVGVTLGSRRQAVLTIRDAQSSSGFELDGEAYTTGEGGGSVTVTVTRPNGSTVQSVRLATSNGTATNPADYTALTQTLSFPVGVLSVTRTIAVNSDSIDEGTEFFNVRLSNPSAGATLGTKRYAAVILSDDDAAGLIASLASPYWSAFEGQGTATIFVFRVGGSSGQVTVQYATSNNGTAVAGSDYVATTGTVTWADGETGYKTFTIPLMNDTVREGLESFNVTLSSPAGGARLLVEDVTKCVMTIVDPTPN